MPSPELVMYRPRPGCRLSIILLDWGVRESFHSLHYLNRQTAAREQYELIWLEFYGRKPLKLQEMVFRQGKDVPLIDEWVVAGYGSDTIFNKHRLYNLGLLLAQGQHCVFCDSDAIFTPDFVGKLIKGFEETPQAVLHLDEIRNADRRFHPFAYPSIRSVLGEGCINWNGTASRGLDNSPDMLHEANYGACMAAFRDDLIALGGADEHLDYLGYICGPYDMTFRLVNHGLTERWLGDEYLYHVWHPNESGINTDYQGPCDGRGVALRALQSRNSGRVMPFVENPWVRQTREGERLDVHQLLRLLAEREESEWCAGRQPPHDENVYLLEPDYHGFNLFRCRRRWYALPVEEGFLDPTRMHKYRALLEHQDMPHLKQLVDYYHRLPKTWMGRVAAQPLTELPRRAVRKIRKELGRWL